MAGPQLVSRVLAEFVGQSRVGDPPQLAALVALASTQIALRRLARAQAVHAAINEVRKGRRPDLHQRPGERRGCAVSGRTTTPAGAAQFDPSQGESAHRTLRKADVSKLPQSAKVGHRGQANKAVPAGWIRRIVDARFAMQ